jgi:hypothetical protein
MTASQGLRAEEFFATTSANRSPTSPADGDQSRDQFLQATARNSRGGAGVVVLAASAVLTALFAPLAGRLYRRR